jgi:hypothetical protein
MFFGGGGVDNNHVVRHRGRDSRRERLVSRSDDQEWSTCTDMREQLSAHGGRASRARGISCACRPDGQERA